MTPHPRLPRLSAKFRERLSREVVFDTDAPPARPIVPRVPDSVVVDGALGFALAKIEDMEDFIDEKGLTAEWRAWRQRRAAEGSAGTLAERLAKRLRTASNRRVVPQVGSPDSGPSEARTEG